MRHTKESQMRGKSKHPFITLAVGLGLTLALLWLVGYAQPAHADPGVLYVAPDGDDANNCASITNRCRTIQRAVDVARPGDEFASPPVSTPVSAPAPGSLRPFTSVRR